MNKRLEHELCGKCDKEIKNMKKAIWGAVTFQTYYEPAVYAYICEDCIKLEELYAEEEEKAYKEYEQIE